MTSVPSVVQATTLMSDSSSSRARRPSSTIAWSSASSTRIMSPASLYGEGDGQGGAAAGRAVDREGPAEHLHAILDSPQPEVPAFHAHVFLAREHVLGVEAFPVVRDAEFDRSVAPSDADALAR